MDHIRKETPPREELTGVNGFARSELGERYVDPAGEEALVVPDALAVAEQQKPVHARLGAHGVGALGITAMPGSSLPSSSSSEAPPPVEAHDTL